jgi:hypothetical protein
MVNRPYPKLSYKYFGPYTILEWIGDVAYKLELSVTAKIHPIFHVYQLKPFLADYTPVYKDLLSIPDLTAIVPVPAEIFERRLVRKGNAATPQILVKWAHLPVSCSTWEDYYVLKSRFPHASLWEEELAHGGDSVTPPSPSPQERDNESTSQHDSSNGPSQAEEEDVE